MSLLFSVQDLAIQYGCIFWGTVTDMHAAKWIIRFCWTFNAPHLIDTEFLSDRLFMQRLQPIGWSLAVGYYYFWCLNTVITMNGRYVVSLCLLLDCDDRCLLCFWEVLWVFLSYCLFWVFCISNIEDFSFTFPFWDETTRPMGFVLQFWAL